MKTVYLAGPITGLTYGDSTDWRDGAIEFLSLYGVKGLSPMRGKDYLDTGRELTILDSYPEHPMSTEDAITTRDRMDATTCDMLLINLLGAERVSIGTMIEIGWADSNQIPIILVIEDEGNLHDHAMVRSCAGFRVNSLEAGLEIAALALR